MNTPSNKTYNCMHPCMCNLCWPLVSQNLLNNICIDCSAGMHDKYNALFFFFYIILAISNSTLNSGYVKLMFYQQVRPEIGSRCGNFFSNSR